jgi:3-hydroxyisobutyrate dehydrogenase-like beta-hydroxyacid dehydrogenase
MAFLGLGLMGRPMAANLIKAGHDLAVWNRTAATAQAFAGEHGAAAAANPAAAAAGADVVITMLADDGALVDCYGRSDGILAGLRPGAVAVDMSTVSPATARHLRAQCVGRGAEYVDAPVSGSVAAAAAATLTIMAGGTAAAVEAVRPVLGAMGEPVIHVGAGGTGATMKLAVNSIVHGLNGAVSEALVLAERAGIARAAAYSVFLSSAVAAPFVHYRQAAFERPDEVPVAFRLALAAKDLRLALALGRVVGAELPQTVQNLAVLERAVAAGLGEHDESAVAALLRNSTMTTGASAS